MIINVPWLNIKGRRLRPSAGLRTLRTWCLTFLVLGLLLTGCVQAQQTTETSIIVLVDISKSFFPLTYDTSSALERVTNALVTKATHGEWKIPVSLLWSTIGHPRKMVYPCGGAIQYDPSKLFNRDPRIKRKAKGIRIWQEACLLRFSGNGIKASSNTMISGALDFAAQSTELIPGLKVLVLLSDFKESLPANTSPSDFILARESVILLYGLDKLDKKDNPSKAKKRALQWKNKLKQVGAGMVCTIPVFGLQPGRIMQCLNTFTIPPDS